MKTLVLCSFVLFAACNTAPDGVIVDGDEARVATLALLDFFDRSGELADAAKWRPEVPNATQQRWLQEHDFEYFAFYPDTTRMVAGTRDRPIYAGFLIYRR